jgi:hypothetical protein
MLDGEKHMVDDVGRNIDQRFGSYCLKMKMKDVMTGRGRVLLVVPEERRDEAKNAAEELAARLEERYGFEIEFRVYTWADAPPELSFG